MKHADHKQRYHQRAQLVMRVLPLVAEHECFALKGGTAINYFLRDFPRLSVDIDLVYLPAKPRVDALAEIHAALDGISEQVLKHLFRSEVAKHYKRKSDSLRLTVKQDGVSIKVELSPVMRETIFEPTIMSACKAVEEKFNHAKIAVASFPDVYAGKICAALDRQHPRDLFDVKLLLENEGLTNDLRKAFLVYLVSGNKPIANLLRPQLPESIMNLYKNDFIDMAEQDASLQELKDARERLISLVHKELTDDEKAFLLSFKNRNPDWHLLGLENVSELPAIRWRQINLAKMDDDRHADAYQKLKEALEVREV